jgi:hypothetical protein
MEVVSIKAPTWLHRHVLGQKGVNIKPIHDAFPSTHVNFLDTDVIVIEGPTADVKKVAAQLEKTVEELVR